MFRFGETDFLTREAARLPYGRFLKGALDEPGAYGQSGADEEADEELDGEDAREQGAVHLVVFERVAKLAAEAFGFFLPAFGHKRKGAG